MLAGSGVTVHRESRLGTIVEVTLGPDSQRASGMGLVSSSVVERTPEDKTYDIYLTRGRVQQEGLTLWGQWEAGAPAEI